MAGKPAFSLGVVPGDSAPGEISPLGAGSRSPHPKKSPTRSNDYLIGAAVVVVILLAVLIATGVIPVFRSNGGPPPSCGTSSILCAPLVAIGAPIQETCPRSDTLPSNGCSAGDTVFNMTVEESSATFQQFQFRLVTPNGTIYNSPGGAPGFSVLNGSGAVVAYWVAPNGEMNMTTGWTYAMGFGSSTPLLNVDTIHVDVGPIWRTGQGCAVVTVNSLSGNVIAAQTLP